MILSTITVVGTLAFLIWRICRSDDPLPIAHRRAVFGGPNPPELKIGTPRVRFNKAGAV